MDKIYTKEEDEFLSDVAIDYVALSGICHQMMNEFKREPNVNEFNDVLNFISFLFKK